MEHAKKMLLIEPSLIEKLNQTSNVDNHTSRLDTEMKKILNSNMDDRKKCILYLQMLNRYLHFNEENRRPIELPIIDQNVEFTETNIKSENEPKESVSQKTSKEEETNEESTTSQIEPLYSISRILDTIPKTYSKKGESLLHLISLSKNKIHWDEDGTVVIDNKKIVGSNILDLINDVLRPLKRDDPLGWKSFSSALYDIKIPLMYLGNPKRIKYINELKSKKLGEISSEEEFHTPTKYIKKVRKKLDWEKWTPY